MKVNGRQWKYIYMGIYGTRWKQVEVDMEVDGSQWT